MLKYSTRSKTATYVLGCRHKTGESAVLHEAYGNSPLFIKLGSLAASVVAAHLRTYGWNGAATGPPCRIIG